MREKSLVGAINARKEILFVRSRYMRARSRVGIYLCNTYAYIRIYIYICVCGNDAGRGRSFARTVVAACPGRPQAEHRRVPGIPGRMRRARIRRAARGDFGNGEKKGRRASLTEKNSFFSRREGAESRKSVAATAVAVHRGPLVKILFTSAARQPPRSRGVLNRNARPCRAHSATFDVIQSNAHRKGTLLIRSARHARIKRYPSVASFLHSLDARVPDFTDGRAGKRNNAGSVRILLYYVGDRTISTDPAAAS